MNLNEEAINLSIKKYERYVEILKENFGKKLVDIETIKLGTDGCSLCNLFFNKNCCGCPIREKTGYWECKETPYIEIVHHPSWMIDDIIVELFQKEVDFLELLRENNK